MTVPAYSSFTQWHCEGRRESYVRTRKSSAPFHFARMFKQSVGVPPRVYLTQLRLEKACELLEMTDLPVTEIAQEVGYSSNQVLARVFIKHRRMSPSNYRRAVRDPVRPSISLGARAALEGGQ
jgi:AraC family transcriptional regulator